MTKTALYRDSGDSRRIRRHGRVWEHFPVAGHVVAYDSIDLLLLADYLDEIEAGKEREDCIESIYVLTKGWVSNSSTNDRVAFSSDLVVAAMTVELQGIYQSGWEPHFQISDYFPEAALGSVLRFQGRWSEERLKTDRDGQVLMKRGG